MAPGAIHDRWLPLFRANFQGAPNPVPAKAALLAMGLIERDDTRAPLLPLDDGAPGAAHRAAAHLGLVDAGGRRGRRARRDGRRMTGAVRTTPSGLSILDELDAGTRRAAAPDPSVPGGWRTDPEVKAAILDCFRDRATETWDLGGVLRFRDRVGLPPKSLLDGREAGAALDAGRPWRIVPGGTSVRAGVYLGPGVVVMPPSFVNVGAWIGEDTMVDSHVLVGSCAQVGARVHLSAGVTLGGVLEPAGARPVIVEDDAFVGAGSSLLEGVLVGAGAVIGAGRRAHGDLPALRSRPWTGADRHRPTRRSRSRPGPSWCPGRGRSAASSRASTGSPRPSRCWSRTATPGPTPGSPWRTPCDDDDGDPHRDPPRRPARRRGPGGARHAVRDAATTPTTSTWSRPRSRPCGRSLPATFDLAFAVKANPLLAVLGHLAGLGVGADVASGGELRHVLRAGFDASRVVFTGPGKRDEELAAAVDGGVRVVTVESRGELERLAAIAAAPRAAPGGPAAARRCPRRGGEERVRIIGDDGAGKFGMDLDDLRAAAADAVASPHLEPLGIHAFGASNVLDAEVLAAHVEATVETAAAVAREAGFPLRLVDAGGGLGIPYDGRRDGSRPRGAGRASRGDRRGAWPRIRRPRTRAS